MSQYPSPYQPYSTPPLGYDPAGNYQKYLARFSRAGMMLFVTGGLMLAMGSVCGGLGALVNWDVQLQDAAQRGQILPSQLTPALLQASFLIVGIASFILGLTQVILAIFVRKAGLASTITAIVITSLALLGLILLLASSGLQAAANPQAAGSPAGAMVAMCFLAVALVLAILQLVWLSMAAKGYSALQAAKAQYNAQYWQYVQAQQGYMQPTHGIPQPPPGQLPATAFGGTGGPPIPPPPGDGSSTGPPSRP